MCRISSYINLLFFICNIHKIAFGVKLSNVASEYEHVALALQFVKGGVGNIPCNISLNQFVDQVQTVIWYKEINKHSPTPIYTFDVRDKMFDKGEHWSDKKILTSRGSFRYQDEPAKLVITNLRESDAGMYYCRVDFKQEPTINIPINVTITVSPEKIMLIDEAGSYIDNYVLGPYSEGDSVNVTCMALGGRPLPNVTWWNENEIIDNVSEITTRKRVKNTLYLHHLERKDVHAVYTCQASNNINVPPLTASITLDIYFTPLWAKIWGKQRVLVAGNTYEISCEVIGSRPRPLITWWLESAKLVNARELSNTVNYTSISFLTFKPSLDQDNKIVTCRGVHPISSGSTVEDSWKLKIHYKPLVIATFDVAIDKHDVREGMEVMLHCNIKANPWVYTISWLYNGKAIYNNLEMDTLITNQSLLIKNVNRSRNGNFTCVGINLEGRGESNAIRLDVKYAPVCRPGQSKIYRTTVQNRVEIRCELEANPKDVEFTWKFKYSDGNIVNLPENFITSEGTVSTIYYTPSSEDDFPTLICNGKNNIGETEDSCIFHLLPIDLPEAPSNCKVTKQTESSLHVECIDEFNRGIRGEFIMEVYDAQTGKLVRNVTSRDPTFVVGELESGIGFDIDLYVLNKEGKSLVTHLPTFTLNNDQTANLSLLPSITALLGMLAGIVGLLILLAVIIVVVIRSRAPKDCNDLDENGFQDSSGRYMSMRSSKLTNKTDSNSYDSFDTDSRDVIPELQM